ncbi:MAG TPA: alpha/beta-hydrolase family protein [Woeseiaceae bacterium]|nr:alpha/beta-hydrolase family protein [Woeseiaceae bacterium]
MSPAVALDTRAWKSFSSAGLLLGTLFAAFSLTPSLLPRSALMQGLVAGLSLAAGYAIGVIGGALWRYLELPLPRPRAARIVRAVAGVACLAVAVIFLLQAPEWQDSIRVQMDMPPVESTRPLTVGFIALLVFIVLLVAARLFRFTYRWIAQRLRRFVPRRVSNVVAIAVAAMLFWSAMEGLLFRYLMNAADQSFQQLDALMEPEAEQPRNPLKTGSTQSLLTWNDLGRAGREYIASGPSAADLEAFFGEATPEPIRVYVGLNSAETVAARVRLALNEMRRVGAFERSALILITPTGTGWVDPGAINTVEYLHRGDIASVAVQYSYLASAISLLVEPENGAKTAEALFAAVYGHWSELPHDSRPRLYLHGLSLGALNSDRSFHIYDIVGDPFHGALWSGPPFRSETWRAATQQRAPGSPAWLPRFRDSRVIRFTNQENRLEMPGVPWGPLRIAFLQYATDPVTFFEPSLLWRRPEWLQPPRGPDVTPALRWIPVVTMLQVLADTRAGSITPQGHGHNYAPDDYIDAWLALTEPPGWTDAEILRLKALFAP